MTTYIAGPMTGIPGFNYPAFNACAESLRSKGIEVRNPAEHFNGNTELPYEVYLRAAIRSLIDCDAMVLLPHWLQSRGARLEYTVARALGMRISEWSPALGAEVVLSCDSPTDLAVNDRAVAWWYGAEMGGFSRD